MQPLNCTRLAFIALLFLSFSILGQAQQSSVQPQDWNSGLKLNDAVDINPDPRIVEVNLETRIAAVELGGKLVEAWTYNGSIPGPLIRTKVGDRLIVHFTNRLPDSTTVHWHGIRVPIEMDGVPGISQSEVGTDQSFTYDFVVPDAGLFWYHPHVQSATQVGFGLTGPLIVEDPSEKIGVSDELVLVLNDIDLTEKGTLADPNSGGSTAMAFGREGDTVLVNGRQNAQIRARSGSTQRWRIVNTAKSRYFNLSVPGSVLTKIGGDGGLQEYPTKDDYLVLAPGERADVIVSPKGKPGTEIQVMSELFNRGYGSVEFRLAEKLFRIALTNQPAVQPATLPKISRTIEPLKMEGAKPVSIALDIIQTRDRMFEYLFNGKPLSKVLPIPAKVGDTQIWTIINNTPWSHPIHLHGFFFQVLDQKDQLVHPLEWKDTVSVPFKQTLKLLVRFDDRPGSWMVHCHILDHAEGGLMSTVQLGEGPAKPHTHAP
jgi:FtsP/CotA-like multicopper oxidase with cupredoxin domain